MDIAKARRADHSENGKCSMCSSGDQPARDGYHWHDGKKYLCGNVDSCILCHGCLPPGEVCQGCFRKNMHDVTC